MFIDRWEERQKHATESRGQDISRSLTQVCSCLFIISVAPDQKGFNDHFEYGLVDGVNSLEMICSTWKKLKTCCSVDDNRIEHYILLPTLFMVVNNTVRHRYTRFRNIVQYC